MAAADRASEAFTRLMLAANPAGHDSWLGIEHEFSVVGRDGRVDFRHLITTLDVGPQHLNPADAYGYRLPSGSWLTSDDLEAEVAAPPIPLLAGFSQAIPRAARAARSELVRLLPEGTRIEGVSTHISVTTPAEIGWEVARLFVETFSPALMLAMDGTSSPGLVGRPRSGRAELCGEFLEGTRLGAATALAAGGLIACANHLRQDDHRLRFPERVRVVLTPTWQRYGWFVDRRAFGPDLYTDGRDSRLTGVTGASFTAQSHLDLCWHVARAALGERAGSDDLEVMDAMVAGRVPLPLEDPEWETRDEAHRRWAQPQLSFAGFSELAQPKVRDAFAVDAVLTTWDLVVYLLLAHERGRHAFACVPRTVLATFHRLLDAGGLDEAVYAYLSLPAGERLLLHLEQTRSPALFDRIGSRQALLPPERPPEAAPPA